MTTFRRLGAALAVLAVAACSDHTLVDPTGIGPSAVAPSGRNADVSSTYVHIDGSSCADVKANNPAAADGNYVIAPTTGPAANFGFAVYCAGMSTGSPAEYLSLAEVGAGQNTSLFPGYHKTWSYQGFPILYGTDAKTQYLKIRIDPTTLVVSQNDRAFINAISIGVSPHDPTNANFNPVPQYATYGVAADCYGIGSALGTANIDLEGTAFALADNQTFANGGFGAAGTYTVSADREVVNATGGGWCGSTGPVGGLTLKLVHAYPVDRIAPVTTSDAPAAWVNHDVTVALSATDAGGSGVAATYYTVDGGAQQQGASITLSTEGSHTIAFWSADVAGNVEAHNTATVDIDKTLPTITGTASTTDWTSHPVVVTFTCSDAGSGIATCPDPITVTTSGANQSVTATATDKAGNSASVTVGDININTGVPTITGVASTTAWTNQNVTVTFTCTDALSGIQSCTSPVTVSAQGGNQSVTGTAVNRAGTSATATVSNINIDKTAPHITGVASTTLWTSQAVTVTFTCSDDLSGVATCPQPITVVGEGANQSVTGTATDKAGNSTTITVGGIDIDKTAPTISGVASTTAWTNGSVTVTFSCADNLSGVQSCQSPATVTSEGANQSVGGSARDRAGNTASTTVGNINIDHTAPVIGYTGNAGTYSVDQHVSITCTASDALSGLASNSCANVNADAYTLAIGTNSYSATAIDRAGNSSTASATFTVTTTNPGLCALVERWTSNAGVANSLCVKLTAGSYDAFRNEVSAQSGKKISETNAAILIALSKTL